MRMSSLLKQDQDKCRIYDTIAALHSHGLHPMKFLAVQSKVEVMISRLDAAPNQSINTLYTLYYSILLGGHQVKPLIFRPFSRFH